MKKISAAQLRTWGAYVVLSCSIAFLVLVFVHDALYPFGVFDRLSLSYIDKLFIHRGPLPYAKDSLDVIIVTISDKTEATVPERFPFPRSYYAKAIRNLNKAGVRAIGLDLTFEQPDTKNPNNDDDLFRTIQECKNVVVAGKTDISIDEATIHRQEENFHSIFYAADSSVGSVFVPNDVDGIFRRYMPFAKMPEQERYIPSFAFALYNKYMRYPSTMITLIDDTSFVFPNNHVPKFDDVSMLVNYYGFASKTFRRVDLADVLDDHSFTTKEEQELGIELNVFDDPDIGLLHDNVFKNKIALLGPYFSESKDLFNVPLTEEDASDRNQIYGVELHANALQTLLHQNYLRKLSLPVESAYIIVVSLLTFIVVSSLKQIKTRFGFLFEIAALLFSGGIIFSIITLAEYFFTHRNIVLPIISPIFAVGGNYLGSAVYQYLVERKQKSMIKGMFSQYLNPNVVNELIAHPEKLRLGGEKKELTVFFSDIAGFTSFSERLDPEALVLLLNEYLSAMSDIIVRNRGTLDKYEGDAIMAFWGAPLELANGAFDACTAAVEMQEKLSEIRARWKSEGKPDVFVRMGLNTGSMVVGNMGGAGKFDYTVIGDSVNLGSRLEGANKQYGTYIMMSERTQELVKDSFVYRELDLLVVKGKTQPIKVFELIGKSDGSIPKEKTALLEYYNKALLLYRERKFAEALAEFSEALKIDPLDGPSNVYLQRTRYFSIAPPPAEWNGVFELKTK